MTPQGRNPRQGAKKAPAKKTPAKKAAPSRGGYPRDPAARPSGKKSAAKDPRRFADTPKRANGPQDTGADVHDPDGVRLQKIIAQSGLASRRASEDLIAAGRVQVDGQTVTELGVRVDPKRQVVHVDGVRLQLDESLVYLALNKPPGVISTMAPTDPDGKNRPTLFDYVTNREERLFHVGRLDTDTEGLIILTNDGTLANKLAHPSSEVPKTYLVEVAGPVARDVGRRLREGVQLDDGLARVDSFKLVDSRPGKALLEIVLHSGRNRVIRRMMKEVGYPVLQLARIQIGPVRMGDLRSGRTRALHGAELSSLFDAAGL